MTIQMDISKTLLVCVLLLITGRQVKSRVNFLQKYCIPAPVVGGLIFAILNLALNQTGVAKFLFDKTMQKFFMNLFFTACGFSASIAVLKAGGKKVVLFLGIATLLTFFQNTLAVVLSKLIGVSPLLGLMTGSIPMTGGHGNAAAFAPIAESFGVKGATSIALAAATLGLVAGCILGGPLARSIIEKYDLFTPNHKDDTVELAVTQDEEVAKLDGKKMGEAFIQLFIALGIGAFLGDFMKIVLPNVVLPSHVMGMLGGAIVTNMLPIMSKNKEKAVSLMEIDILGEVSLGLFVTMAVMSMRLWEIASLALPLLILIAGQVVLIAIFVRFITFPLMGKDYDAAVMSAGHIGFGLGATPVAMTNMQTVCDSYKYSKMAFFIVPIIGGLFSNFTNAAIITAFLNYFK
jgi:ESS family glutamate:Na+ symporter